MTYNPNIPAAGDFLSDSQSQIQTNFSTANAAFSRNHVAFPIATDNGKHKFIEMPISATIPAPLPALSSGEGTIYAKTVSAASQLFYTPDASGNEYQMTATSSANFASFAAATNGWTFLPGGLILNYGSTTSVTSSSTTNVTFPRAFSSAVYSVQATVVTNDNSTIRFSLENAATLGGFTTTQTSSSHFTRLYWIAIGR